MKKSLSLILSAITVISALAGCSASPEEAKTSDKVVSSSGNVSVYTDWLTDRLTADGRINNAEIIVGDKATAAEYGVDVSTLSDDGYIIRRTADSATLIFGKTDDGVDRGVRYYANYCSDEGELNVVEGEGYRVGSITIAGAALSEYVIVCPADADECQRFAADQLRKYLGDACGIYPEIVTEADGYAITLVCDKTGEAYGDEGFNVKSHENGITITGGRYRGCMYGVYDLLEEYIGYRFYYRNIAVNGEIEGADVYLYEASSIDIGTDIDYTELPAVRVRDSYGPGTTSPALKSNGERFRYNARYGGYGDVIKACHGYSNYISIAELESYGYYDLMNPCFTDETLNNLLIERILADCKNRVNAGQVIGKDFTTVDISHLDSLSFCQCAECTSVYARSGSKAGPVVKLANRVAEVLDENYPGLTVGILAYCGTDVPPRNMTVHEDVYVSYCFYITNGRSFICGNHSINGEECDTNKIFLKQFNGWKDLTDNLYIWYYPFQAYYLAYSSTYTYNLYNDIKFLADNNIYGIFLHGEGNSVSQTYNTGLINFYMSQRLLWNCDISKDEFMDMMKEYLFLAYGDGYEAVFEYIAIMEKAGDLKDCWCGFYSGIMNKLDLSYIKNNIKLLKELRDTAVRYARTTEQEVLCDRLFASVYYYELVVFHNDMWKNGDEVAKAEYIEMLEHFLANYSSLPIGEHGLGSPSYPPRMEDIDMNLNPLEWVPDRTGGWDSDCDFDF